MARGEVAASNLGVSNAQSYPGFALQTSWMRSDNPVFVFGSLLDQQSFGAANFSVDQLNRPSYVTNIRNALDLRVPVFNAFELATDRNILRRQVDEAKEQMQSEEQKVDSQVVEAYLDALLHKALFDVYAARTASAKRGIEDAKKLNAKGLVLGSDYHAALAIESGLEARLVRLENGLQLARGRLSILMGVVPERINTSGVLSNGFNPQIKVGDLQQTAMSLRHDVRSLDLQLAMAGLSEGQSGRSLLPKIEAFASVETNSDSLDRNPSNRTVGVRSNFPLGDPSYYARKKAATASARATASQKAALEERVHLEVLEAASRFEAARDSVPAMQEAALQAERSLTLFRPLYREGRQSILDVTRAEDDLAKSQQALLENQFEVFSTWTRLLLATGQLDDRAIKELEVRLESKP